MVGVTGCGAGREWLAARMRGEGEEGVSQLPTPDTDGSSAGDVHPRHPLSSLSSRRLTEMDIPYPHRLPPRSAAGD